MVALSRARATKDRAVGGSDLTESSISLREDVRRMEARRTLARAMKARDAHLLQHSSGVAQMALRIGRKMTLDQDQMDAILAGALLHDIGKIGIPDRILLKRGPLSVEEYEVIKSHPVLGVEIVSPFMGFASALPAIRYHHERFDGSGYPDGLPGESTPLVARIVSVADAYDSMIRDRSYGPGVSAEAALEEIRRHSGTQFDPVVVSALLRTTDQPAGPRADFAG